MKVCVNKAVRSARTRPLSRGRAFRAGFRKPNARNGTQPEPRLRTLLCVFKTRHSADVRNEWRILSQRVDIRFARQNKRQHVFGRIDFDAH